MTRFFGRVRRVHFVGIGGVGMCGLAEILQNLGCRVSGSDLHEGPALERLRAYPWPGNVRELRTAIEHGVVMSNDPVIDVRHLPAFLADQGESDAPTAPAAAKIDLAAPAELNLHALETRTIRAALEQAGGNRTRAADLLGVSRRTLQRKLKELGL